MCPRATRITCCELQYLGLTIDIASSPFISVNIKTFSLVNAKLIPSFKSARTRVCVPVYVCVNVCARACLHSTL